MPEAGVVIRSATAADTEQIRHNIKRTLASPDGRRGRRSYGDAAERQELLVMERYDPIERGMRIVGFLEWHLRVDGTATIRDAGTAGDEIQDAVAKRLIREFLRLVSPKSVQVKTREDQTDWNDVLGSIPRFGIEGREYSRPHWKLVWMWPH